MLTDTHCHLDFNKFDEDRQAVIQRALDAGLTRMLIPALDYESALAGIQLAEAYPNVFAAVGFHPTDLEKWDGTAIEKLRALILPHLPPSPAGRESKVVAIGEIGLDYYWVKEPEKQAQQRDVLKQQLRLAQEARF